jgi:hypothetical protein
MQNPVYSHAYYVTISAVAREALITAVVATINISDLLKH